MEENYLEELKRLSPRNPLHRRWIRYLTSLPRDHFRMIVKNGLTHQARAIDAQIREIISGGTVPEALARKLEALVQETDRTANHIRS